MLDFSQVVAGSVAGRMLAEMGAEVIKIEITPNGDGSRTYAVFKDRRGPFTPGVIARMGLGYDAVRAINPRIVMCSLSSFGQSGPLALKPGFDPNRAAYSGMLDMQGEPDGPPVMMGGVPIRSGPGTVSYNCWKGGYKVCPATKRP